VFLSREKRLQGGRERRGGVGGGAPSGKGLFGEAEFLTWAAGSEYEQGSESLPCAAFR